MNNLRTMNFAIKKDGSPSKLKITRRKVIRDTGNPIVMDSSSAGVSSVLVIITPPYDNCETIDLMADHYASDWHGHTYALFW